MIGARQSRPCPCVVACLFVVFRAIVPHPAVAAPAGSSCRAAAAAARDREQERGACFRRSRWRSRRRSRREGLMFRRELPEGQGMLFDFQREQPTSFWMKNTYIPLDMIFIRADGRILRIAENTVPLSEALVSSGRAGARGARGDRRHRQEARHRARRPRGASDLQRAVRIGSTRLAAACWLKTEPCIEARRRRGIAQPGSAGVLGTPGRRFKSCCPDHAASHQTRDPTHVGDRP